MPRRYGQEDRRPVSVARLPAMIAAAALVATGVTVAPASGASESVSHPGAAARHLAQAPVSLGSFTPAAADPRLAALFARGGLADDGFSFTPAQTRRATRAVTVAVRSHVARALVAVAADRPAPTVGLAPVAYNLGAAIGWKRFAVTGDVTHVDLAGQPGSREAADLGVSYTLNRFTGRVKGLVDRPLADVPQLVAQMPSYSVDIGGAYRLAHNVDLTAGMRYRRDLDRLQQPDEPQRHDSQAVYVGTAFKF